MGLVVTVTVSRDLLIETYCPRGSEAASYEAKDAKTEYSDSMTEVQARERYTATVPLLWH